MTKLKRYIFLTINNFFTTGHERSILAKKNIAGLFFIKSLSILINLLLVRLTIDYVSSSGYGVWLTLSSIVGWFAFFDIGLTQGLRNKLAEAIAKQEYSIAQEYVSTIYAVLSIIFFTIWLIFMLINPGLNWTSILNLTDNIPGDVSALALIIFTYFCLSFVLRIVSTILLSDQKPAKSSLIDLLGQIFSLLVVLILIKTTKGSLINLGLALCVAPILVLAGANLFLFKGIYGKFKPSFSKINFSYSRSLLNLGLKFFVIQVASIIQYETANIIIARNFGTVEVTAYNVVFKYFGVLNMLIIIFLTPFWSASTEAYLKNDIRWIKNGIKKYNLLNILLTLMSILMLIFSKSVYEMWLGKGKVNIDFALSFWGFIYFNVIMFGAKYVYFLNGINALSLQFISSLISPVLFLILIYIFIRQLHMGVEWVFIISIISNFNAIFIAPIQYYQIIYKNKKGIWKN